MDDSSINTTVRVLRTSSAGRNGFPGGGGGEGGGGDGGAMEVGMGEAVREQQCQLAVLEALMTGTPLPRDSLRVTPRMKFR